MKFPQIGEILPNGHTVDAAYCVGYDRYVLAHKDGAQQPYVVWSVDMDGDTRNGRYFGMIKEALHCLASLISGEDVEDADDTVHEDLGYAEEYIIRYEREHHGMSVYINGRPLENVKSIELKAVDGRPPLEYQCTMYAPVPL